MLIGFCIFTACFHIILNIMDPLSIHFSILLYQEAVMKTLLQYPVLLVHGMCVRDSEKFSSWGRIPKYLSDTGIPVFYGHQDGLSDIKSNAMYLSKRIDEILLETGAEKVNIIAHSKGGLDSRYAITNLGMGEKVASLTTIATPHNGSKTVDLLMKLPDFFVRFVASCGNFWYKKFGDKKPNCYEVFHCFTTENMRLFNENTPDHPSVYYQSYAFVMKNAFSDFLLFLPHTLVKWVEGDNDGLLTPESVKWTNFRGVYRASGRRGVSHLDEIDIRRAPVFVRDKEATVDIIDFYANLVKELQYRGL